jgi:CubicO group peptidase (beta-lactamase class C family)
MMNEKITGYLRNPVTVSLFLTIFLSLQAVSAQVFPGMEWTEASPASQGVDSTRLKQAVAYLEDRLASANSYTGGLVIIRNGYLIFDNEDSHKVYETMSVSKSFLSTGLGLMIEDGTVSLGTPVKDLDPRIAEKYPSAVIRHFVTMTSGYDGHHIPVHNQGYDCDAQGRCDTWDPGIPLDPIFPPGTKFRYWDEGEMELSYALGLAGGNRYYVRDLLRDRIANPIGMQHFDWRDVETTVGVLPAMNGGLRTSARDLARFGLLFLNRGRWKDQQMIRSSWVDEATSVRVPATVPDDVTLRAHGSGAYGYNWWVNGITSGGKRSLPGAPPTTFWAAGYGTNRCFVIREWNMVIVRTGQKPVDWTDSETVFSTFLDMIGRSIL